MSSEQPPLVKFQWPNADRYGTCFMAWSPQKTVKSYLVEPALRQHHLIGLWANCRVINAKGIKVKLHYIPEPNDTLLFLRTQAES